MKDYGTAGPLRTPTTAATVARALPVAAALAKLYRSQLEVVDAFAVAWSATYEVWRGRADRLQSTDDAAFVEELAECLLTWHTDTERTYFTTIYNNANAQSDLKQMLDKLDRATGGTTSVIDLLVGLSDVSHMALQRGILELYRVAEVNGFDGPAWATALDEFIREHGFHSDIELEIMCPRWSEDPDRVAAMIAAMFDAATTPADPDACLPAQQARFDAELSSVRERIRSSPTARLRFGRPLGKHVRRVRSYLVARERMRDFSSRCYAIVRTYVVEAAARLAADGRLNHPDDVFMLSMHELVDLARGNVSGAALAPAIRFRRAMYEGYRDLNPPHELGGGVTQATGPSTSADGRARLFGLACSPGAVEGTARVIRALDQISELRPGDIMVSPYTDPGWTAAMGLVAGVVTEVGGLLCHAAVISREYGIPAVLNVQGATSMLRSGQRVRVDGSAGTVDVLDDVVADAGAVFEATTFQPQARPALTRGKRFICIAGGDGSGKTTQVARVAAAFEADGQQVAPVTIWDAFLDPKIASKLPFEKPGEIYGYLALLDPVARTHFLFHALHLAFALAADRDADVLVANAYWYKYFATEIAHGGDPVILRQLAAAFPEPDVTFYLAITPDQSLARKVQRSDYESGYGDGDAAFVEFQQRSHEVLDDLSSELGWIPLDGNAPAAEVTSAILDQLTDR
jgi:phosphohistidine swiveling domain-containing protein/thymidylate kinase